MGGGVSCTTRSIQRVGGGPLKSCQALSDMHQRPRDSGGLPWMLSRLTIDYTFRLRRRGREWGAVEAFCVETNHWVGQIPASCFSISTEVSNCRCRSKMRHIAAEAVSAAHIARQSDRLARATACGNCATDVRGPVVLHPLPTRHNWTHHVAVAASIFTSIPK